MKKMVVPIYILLSSPRVMTTQCTASLSLASAYFAGIRITRLTEMNMIKSKLIARLAAKMTHLPEKQVSDSINHLLELMSDALMKDQRIEVRGFGSFSLHYRPPRNAHNPKTGEKVTTAAKYSPHFKPGKALRERVDASKSHKAIQRDDNSL
jgi:integration host factor subunit beta